MSDAYGGPKEKVDSINKAQDDTKGEIKASYLLLNHERAER